MRNMNKSYKLRIKLGVCLLSSSKQTDILIKKTEYPTLNFVKNFDILNTV